MVDKINHCIFCNILLQNKKILFNDEACYILEDIKPVGKIHLLVIPNKHIVNINYLTKDDIPLLEHMKSVSEKYIKDKITNEKEIILGFHKPPRISIKHLHLHIIIPPIMKKKLIYYTYDEYFRSIESVIKKLNK